MAAEGYEALVCPNNSLVTPIASLAASLILAAAVVAAVLVATTAAESAAAAESLVSISHYPDWLTWTNTCSRPVTCGSLSSMQRMFRMNQTTEDPRALSP